MKRYFLPLIMAIGAGYTSASFATDAVLTTNVTSKSYYFTVTTEFSNRSGQVDKSYSYSDQGTFTYAGNIPFNNQEWVIGPQYYRGRYNSNHVDTSKSLIYKGRTYYKITSITSANIYISARQMVYNNETDVANYYDFPYEEHNSALATLKLTYNPTTGSATCQELYNNAGLVISCAGKQGQGDGRLMVGMNTASARSGDIYLYMPNIPTREVVFNNVLITSSTVSGMGMSDNGNIHRATSNSRNAPQYDQFDFYLNGTLKFNNNCRLLNTTGGIAVNFKDLLPGAFTGKGKKPTNVTPVKTDIVFNCDKDIGNTYSGMDWSVTATAASQSSEPGILKATGSAGNTINNLGVKLTKDANGTTPISITGGENAATISGTNATATFYAFPTMISDTKPSGAGGYIATATVTFNVP